MRVKLLKKLRKKMLNKYRMKVLYNKYKPSKFRIYEILGDRTLWSVEDCQSREEVEISVRKHVRDKILDYIDKLRCERMFVRRIRYLW